MEVKLVLKQQRFCDKGFNVKLLEEDKERAFDIADELPKVLVINSDGRNVDF